jgi:Glycosyl hydrolases family 2, sugar binding domain/Glycosyl hydrolases family 2/Glycosyl hydrolases family 2, TIM barrel domain
VISSLPMQSADIAQRLELESGWQLLVDASAHMQRSDAAESHQWRDARVGLSWNAQYEDLRDYMGAAWYRTSFELPAFRDTRHVLLKFGAVDYFCEVFLNDVFIGSHEGGYTPFSFEITSAVHPGANELMIRVIDPPMDEGQNRALFPEMMYNEIPHGKQNWYVQNSGIWQGVRVELCPSIYIERLDVVPAADGHFEILARLAGVGLTAENGAIAGQTVLQADIFDNSGRRVFSAQQSIDVTSHTNHVKGVVASARLWSPEHPALYIVEVSLNGAVYYVRRTRFGFRSFAAREGKLYLNGKPFYMIAALDQDFYPETVHSPTSEAFVRDMMVKAKRLGINVLRCHLKVAHPVYLDVADEVGMLIWTELPSWSDCWFPADHFSTMAAVRAEKMFWEILIRDWNHPCIVLQTIMNESWGIDLRDASQRQWLRATFDHVKNLLSPLGRLVVDNSPCEGNFHVKTDIEDFHQYYSMPDHVAKWDKWLAELADHPAWTFSPYGDAERSGNEPLLVSEFGNWGLPKVPDELPWWFQVSFGSHEVTRPAGVLDRFHDYGFEKMFGSFNEMAEETQWHQFASLKYEIESIRSYGSLQGYVITGITDVHWEVNGLLDMWRNEKVYSRDLSTLQQADVILCKFPRFCFEGGENVKLEALLSHFSQIDLSGARVRWSLDSGASGHMLIPAGVAPGSVTPLSTIPLQLPEVDGPVKERLELEVRLRNGQRVIENSYDVFLLPRHQQRSSSGVVHGPGLHELKRTLNAGEESFGPPIPGAVMIAERYDDEIAAHLQRGGNVLLLADAEDAVPAEWPLKISARLGTELDGRWFSNFTWIRTDRPPFSNVAFTKILGFEAAHVTPDYVIEKISPADFDDVLSGMTFGWLNRNSAVALQMRVGTGKLLLSTYRFDKYGSDPYATRLLNALIDYVASPECQPKLHLSPIPAVVEGR